MFFYSTQNLPCLWRILWTGYQIIDHNDRMFEVKWEAFYRTSRVHFTGGRKVTLKSYLSQTPIHTFSHTLNTILAKSCLFCLVTRILERLDPSSVELISTLWKCKFYTSVAGVGWFQKLVLVDHHSRSKWLTVLVKKSWRGLSLTTLPWYDKMSRESYAATCYFPVTFNKTYPLLAHKTMLTMMGGGFGLKNIPTLIWDG